ncbi:MAG: hypothetical protein V9G11_06905 [Bifidobacterium adolescentis]
MNTNGLRLARDPNFVKRLSDAGASTIFLQFDGARDDILKTLRGRALLAEKRAAIERCIENDLGVVLVPTLVPRLNVDNIGEIIRFAIGYAPGVRGVHFQPVSYFGRYPKPPANEDRITMPEVISAIAEQTGGQIKREHFVPPGGENALCSFHGNFVIMPDGSLRATTKHTQSCCCAPTPAALGAVKSREFVSKQWAAPQNTIPLQSVQTSVSASAFGEWDAFMARAKTHTFPHFGDGVSGRVES